LKCRSVHVFDPKVETLGYDEAKRTLEITFKSGQVWQLFDVPPAIYGELRDNLHLIVPEVHRPAVQVRSGHRRDPSTRR
jgi:hypothetical protein